MVLTETPAWAVIFIVCAVLLKNHIGIAISTVLGANIGATTVR